MRVGRGEEVKQDGEDVHHLGAGDHLGHRGGRGPGLGSSAGPGPDWGTQLAAGELSFSRRDYLLKLLEIAILNNNNPLRLYQLISLFDVRLMSLGTMFTLLSVKSIDLCQVVGALQQRGMLDQVDFHALYVWCS